MAFVFFIIIFPFMQLFFTENPECHFRTMASFYISEKRSDTAPPPPPPPRFETDPVQSDLS